MVDPRALNSAVRPQRRSFHFSLPNSAAGPQHRFVFASDSVKIICVSS